MRSQAIEHPVILLDLFIIRHLLLLFFALGMSTMKENKEKEVVGEENHPKTQSQARPLVGDKKRSLSKNLDLGNLPNRRGKKAKHGSSQTVKPNLPSSQLPVKITWTRPLQLRPLRPSLLRPRRLCLPHPSLLNGSLQILLTMKT